MDYSFLSRILPAEWRVYREEIEEIRVQRWRGAYMLVALLKNGGFWTLAVP